MDENKIILPITPQTNVRSTQGDRVGFWIPEDCPIGCGLPRRSAKQPLVDVKTMAQDYPELIAAFGGEYSPRKKKKQIRYGCPHCITYEGLMKRRRLERYNQYKIDILTLAKQKGFEMPTSGWAWYFYIPIPVSVTAGKRRALHGQFHIKRPDLNNYEKAAEDGLSVHDETVAQRSGHGKFWVNTLYLDEGGNKKIGPGWIEILLNQPVYNPFGVTFIDQDAMAKAAPRKYVLTKKKAPRGSLQKKETNIK